MVGWFVVVGDGFDEFVVILELVFVLYEGMFVVFIVVVVCGGIMY